MKTNDRLIDLVKKVKGGNNAVFTDLYNESYKYLHTCVIHIVKDEDVAQDMLQDAYVEIYKNIGQLKDEVGFLGWAATIANRKCFAYLKKNKDLLVDEQTDDEGNETDYFDAIADDEAFIPENILDNQEKIKIIRGIIDDLTDVQRACVIGFYYNEQKQDEIANELGLPVNTVKSHLNRAKVKIKEAVGDTERKQGIKLYSIAPFMLLFFLKDTEVYAAELSVPAMSAGLSSAVSGSTVTSSTAATGAKTVGMAIKTKVIAGIVAGAVVVGGITGVALHKEKPAEPEVIEEVTTVAVVEEVGVTEEIDNHVDVTINIDDILNQISLDGTQISNMTYEQFSSMEGAIESRKEDDTLSGYGRFGNGIHLLWKEDGNIQVMDGRGALVNDNIDDVFKSWTITADDFLDNYSDGLYNKLLDEGTVFFNNGQMIFRMFPDGQKQISMYFDNAGTFGMNCIYINMKDDDAKVFSYGFEKTDVRQEGKPLSEYEEEYKESSVGDSIEQDVKKDFVSAHDIRYSSDLSFDLPYVVEFTDEETRETVENEDYKFVPGISTLTITDATISESDEAGFVDIIITAETVINPRMLQMTWNPVASKNSTTSVTSISTIFDKYTGRILPSKSTLGNSKYDSECEIEYDGKIYSISRLSEGNWDKHYDDWVENNGEEIDGCVQYFDIHKTLKKTETLHVSKDYDGLVIAIPQKGTTERAKNYEMNDEEQYMFEPDENGEVRTENDYYYISVTDLLEQFN